MWCNVADLLLSELQKGFQCRTQHFMWCNDPIKVVAALVFSFNAARSILCGATTHYFRLTLEDRFNAARSILCGATSKSLPSLSLWRFNAARSIICGATIQRIFVLKFVLVSMPHAALYVVQQTTACPAHTTSSFNAARSIICGATPCGRSSDSPLRSFNAARSIICGATSSNETEQRADDKFQCRTQHYMWCNLLAILSPSFTREFQCRTQHYMWCNSEFY